MEPYDHGMKENKGKNNLKNHMTHCQVRAYVVIESMKTIAELETIIINQAKIIDSLTLENKLLHQKVNAILKKYFGCNKSEKLNFDQLELFNSLEISHKKGDSNKNESLNKNISSQKTDKKKVERKIRALPNNLPKKENIIIPDEVKENPDAYRYIGEEISVELDINPQQLFKRVTIRKKYVKIDSPYSPPIIGALPLKLIEKSYASAGLLTHIIISKYLLHLPLYRIEKRFKEQYQVELSRKTMSNWLAITSNWLKPIYLAMKDEVKSHGYMQIDETPITYLSEFGAKKGYFWVFTNPSGNRVFEWHTGRAHTCLNDMLINYIGLVHCDAYSAYECYSKKNKNIKLLLCWAHARRKFYDAINECPEEASWFLKQIQHLYYIEKYLRKNHSSPKIRTVVRQANAIMILNRIKKALDLKLLKHTRKSSLMHKAIVYSLSHWKMLFEYVNHGNAEIDNNLVENAIRPTAIGKKNWLFIGHPEAGEKSAIIYSFLETCRAHNINANEYILDVLSKLPTMRSSEFVNYTPLKWLERKKTLEAA